MDTFESLLAKNITFNKRHGLMPSDLELANHAIGVIEGTRSAKEPRAGDRIVCKGSKKEYAFGHMDRPLDDDWAQICVDPSVPFVFTCRDDVKIGSTPDHYPSFSTSGGYWISCTELEMFEYVGTAKKLFCIWGSAGACGGGAIHFEAPVNVWKLFLESIY